MIGIFGAAGAIGASVAAEAQRRTIPVRVVGRREDALRNAFGDAHEIVTADLQDPQDAKRAAQGLDAIVHAVGVPYDRFGLHPLIMQYVVEAARDAGVGKLVVISNVYSYGRPRTSPVDEDEPREPETFKGRMRREQEDIALAAHCEALKTLVLRLPDFYGPSAENSLANEIVKGARADKSAPVFAPIEMPHEWMFTPDVGPVVCDLLARDDVFGTAYNFAGVGTMTTREFATKIFSGFGEKPKLQVVTTWMLRLAGLFNPLMREFVEMQYLQSDPVILDDAKLARALGPLKKTSYADGIAQTVAAAARR
jgi:nucleoside-diphosphate-sugar epimerase